VSGTDEPEVVPGWSELFRGGYARTTVGLLLLETLVAVQILVTVAVLPAVVAELGGIGLYGAALGASALATTLALPVTPRLVARWGLRAVFVASVVVFTVGALVVVLAPSMPLFVLGRLVEGAAGGAQYALVLTIFTRRYPPRLRPRMLALWAGAWAVPGLVGPAYGGLVASTLGWRWAFGLLVPLMMPSVVLLLRDLAPSRAPLDEPESEPASWAALLTLGVGMLLVFAALALGTTWGLVVGAIGLVPSTMALRAILPAGSFTARPGLPAVIATTFLANMAFFAVEGFLPAMLTSVRGLSLTVAGVVVTLGVLAWVAGSWWQSRAIQRRPARRLVAAGGLAILVGIAGAVLADLGAPLVVAYGGWGVAGFGMGVAYPTVTLLATELASPDDEVVTLSQYQLSETLGAAAGPGLGGGALSLSLAAGLSLQAALLSGFALAFVVGCLMLSTSLRLPGSATTLASAGA
jgi:MFS family permease